MHERRDLTGEALVALQSNGRFRMPLRALTTNGGVRLLSSDEAESLALAYLRAFGGAMSRDLADGRGSVVEVAGLRPCANSQLTESPWREPGRGELTPLRAWLGPVWIVTLCRGTDPQVVASVGALLADLGTETDILSSISSTSAGFAFASIPPGAVVTASPEEAAREVARRTGRRVAKVPLLIRADAPVAGFNAMWQVEIETPVSISTSESGSASSTAVFFYGSIADDRWIHDIRVADVSIGKDSLITVELNPEVAGSRREVVTRSMRPHFRRLSRLSSIGGQTP